MPGFVLLTTPAHADETGESPVVFEPVTVPASPASDPFPTLEIWLVPEASGIPGYCLMDCRPCLTIQDCGGCPCTEIPAC